MKTSNLDDLENDVFLLLLSESAGSASTAFHLLSPGSRNLFSQAIMQSAAATNPWGMLTAKEAKLRARRLAEVLKCPHQEVGIFNLSNFRCQLCKLSYFGFWVTTQLDFSPDWVLMQRLSRKLQNMATTNRQLHPDLCFAIWLQNYESNCC